jgi:hypothetical protein
MVWALCGDRVRFARDRFRWVYWPPLIHLAICLVAMLAYIVPSLQLLGMLQSVIAIADFPVSFVMLVLDFSSHGMLAWVWALIAGTMWWYLLCLTAEFLAARIRKLTMK